MEDFDLLYLMKTPFYLGDFDKCLQEAEKIEINQEDLRNQQLRNLFTVRALTSKLDLPSLKTFMTGLLQDPMR